MNAPPRPAVARSAAPCSLSAPERLVMLLLPGTRGDDRLFAPLLARPVARATYEAPGQVAIKVAAWLDRVDWEA